MSSQLGAQGFVTEETAPRAPCECGAYRIPGGVTGGRMILASVIWCVVSVVMVIQVLMRESVNA